MYYTRLLALISFVMAFPAFSMDLQTRSHPMCGVGSYVSLSNDSRCPVAAYVAKSTPACAPVYNSKRDFQVCGADPVLKVKRCQKISGSGPALANPPDPELGCPAGYKEVENSVPAACTNPAFGIKGYEVCRDPSHGPESYQTCSRPEFGIASYQTCSFYKTPEELRAFIDATNESVDTYAQILPAREAELLSRVNGEGAFACLIRKYTDPLYEKVVEDLEAKFLLVFGYESKDSVVDCSVEPEASTKIKFNLGSLDCDSIDKDSLANMVKPAEVADNTFKIFKQNCTMKKSYDGLVDWFETKKAEVSLLEGDLAAKADPDSAARLQELRTKLDSK